MFKVLRNGFEGVCLGIAEIIRLLLAINIDLGPIESALRSPLAQMLLVYIILLYVVLL